ncbi:hypothetical protein BA190_10240 [Labrys sp. WJW]|uniref:hypothetical protein n=1 Tax=Labrys sp. WJW TaxID=1737983 RepID=UPI00082B8C6E|nr:hypothetical protein [Labrys sp. WJW]OCC05273.1 hypothetical protein BA190_10240 [Labrys sp. WJW]
MARLWGTGAVAALAFAAIGPAGAAEYRQTTVEDYRVDQKQLFGQKVEMSGFVFVISEAWLKRNADDMVTTRLDIDGLPRETRKTLMSDCQLGCQARLQGTVSRINGTLGITVDNLAILSKAKP